MNQDSEALYYLPRSSIENVPDGVRPGFSHCTRHVNSNQEAGVDKGIKVQFKQTQI